MRFTYIVKCKDNTLYTGFTNNIKKRVFDHNNSKIWAKYTKSRRPVKLVRKQKTESKISAMQLEYRIKKITREKKQKIIKSKIKVIFSEKSLPKIKMEKQQSFAK